MPTKRYNENGVCFYRWGDSGKKYIFPCGNEEAAQKAKEKADRQGAAVHSTKYSENSIKFYMYYDK